MTEFLYEPACLKTCRACLTMADDMISILDTKTSYNMTIKDIIMNVTDVHISEKDGLTVFVCSKCMMDAQGAYDFKIRCETSDSVLRSKAECLDPPPDSGHSECDDVPKKQIKRKRKSTRNQRKKRTVTQATSSCEIADATLPEGGSQNDPLVIDNATLPSYSCNVCEAVCENDAELIGHKEKEHGIENGGLVTCDECKSVFESSILLDSHREVGKKRHHSCDVRKCKFKFDSVCELRKHKAVRHIGKGRKAKDRTDKPPRCKLYKCKKCPKFASPKAEELDAHNAEMHPKKMFSCEVCSYKTHGIMALRDHKAMHAKIFACDVCGYRTRTKGALSKHRAVHSEKKPPSCLLCKDKAPHPVNEARPCQFGNSAPPPEFQTAVFNVHEPYHGAFWPHV